jgi:biotin operon repressor
VIGRPRTAGDEFHIHRTGVTVATCAECVAARKTGHGLRSRVALMEAQSTGLGAPPSRPSIVRTGWCVLLVLVLLLPQAGCSEPRRSQNDVWLAVRCDRLSDDLDPAWILAGDADSLRARGVGIESGHALRRRIALCIDARVPIPALRALLKVRTAAITERIDALWREGSTLDRVREAHRELVALSRQVDAWPIRRD